MFPFYQVKLPRKRHGEKEEGKSCTEGLEEEEIQLGRGGGKEGVHLPQQQQKGGKEEQQVILRRGEV